MGSSHTGHVSNQVAGTIGDVVNFVLTACDNPSYGDHREQSDRVNNTEPPGYKYTNKKMHHVNNMLIIFLTGLPRLGNRAAPAIKVVKYYLNIGQDFPTS